MAKPWEQSPEFKQAKQIVDSVVKQVAAVKADTARITPKLATYRKATLEKLLKEAKAGMEQALRKNQALLRSGPERGYMVAIGKEEDVALTKAKQEYEAAVKAISATLKAYADAASDWEARYGAGDGVSGGTAGVYFRLLNAHEAQKDALAKELAALAKEHEPNPKRTV